MPLPNSYKKPEVPQAQQNQEDKVTEQNVFIPKVENGKRGRQQKQITTFEDATQKFLDKFKARTSVEFMDSGSISFNHVFGGGLPRGRLISLHSPAGLGKTTSVLHFARAICMNSGRFLFLDIEHALNDSLIDGCGLTEFKDKSFLVYSPDTFADCEEILDDYLNCTTPPDGVAMDSITALTNSKLISGKIKVEDVEPGWHARLAATFLNKYKHKIPSTGTSFITINQERTKIRFMAPCTVEAGGGAAQQYFPDIIVEMQRTKNGDIMDGDANIGVDAAIQALKNKLTLPYVGSVVSIIFGKGISNARAATFLLQAEGAVVQNQSIFKIDLPGASTVNACGRTKFEEWVKDNEPKVIEFLKSRGRI